MSDNPQGAPMNKAKLGIWAAIVIVLLVLVGIFVVAKTSAIEPPTNTASASPSVPSSPAATPKNVTEDGGVLVSGSTTKDGAANVVIYVDFICPACKQFDEKNGAALQEMATKGDISLEYRPIAILDRASTSKYSTRAVNAFACVADSSPEKSVAFINKLMEEQPEERTAGLTNEQLSEHASSVGAESAAACITDQEFISWPADVTKESIDRGLTHTPFVVINDSVWDGKSNLFNELASSSQGSEPTV